jgi:MoxR-like ATPase
MSDQSTHAIDQAVAEGGAYEVLRKRLTDQGQKLVGIADTLNTKRLTEFGDTKMEIAGRMRIRSENNAVGRDIVQVGELLLFGYNVFIGLKTTTNIADVFSLYRLVDTTDGYDVTPVDLAGSFLSDPIFKQDFKELYDYYKDARLTRLLVRDGKLLAAFQIGQKITDTRVFRWSVGSDGDVSYIDMRGERDILPPPAFDFEWIRASKDMEVSGRFPHLSILNTLFVETSGGDLTIKVENNTETGQGIYSDPVEDATQSLDDAQIEYAKVGSLILLRVLPYRETQWRGLVYNTLTRKVVRLDAIIQACISLPEDHGIIFPGGYYLQNGEHKSFDASMAKMAYKRNIRSPNGEDVLYIFYDTESGTSALLVYNMVRRQLMPPIFAHGYARLADGRMVLFHAENDNPTRVHQMQVWITPFSSDEFAATRPPLTSPLGRIGNAELVRAISDFYDLAREVSQEEVSSVRYEKLTNDTRKLFDTHHWITDELTGGLSTLLHEVAGTSESILDEFEKVQQIRKHSETSLIEATEQHRSLLGRLQPDAWHATQNFVDSLNEIAALRGRLLTIREYRYIDTAKIDAMSDQLAAAHESVGQATGTFLADPKAIAPLEKRLDEIDSKAQKAATASQLAKHLTDLTEMSADLDMLSQLMAGLKVDDATERTRVVDAISGLYARLNQARARADQRRKSLGTTEAVAQFGAQFALFSQSVTSALGMAQTPEKADEQLSRLMVQLEELESQFGEYDQFLGDILTKREELIEAFETHKQALLDDRQRKAQSVGDAAARILEGLSRRTERFQTPDELNSFFVGDALIQKLRDLVGRLREIKDSVRADDIESRIKAARDQAVRALRDRSDLFEDGGNAIKLGPRHKFSVNTQTLDLTLLPREDYLALHLTGTDYHEPIKDAGLEAFRPFWSISLESESNNIYRGEYLAGQILQSAIEGKEGLSLDQLQLAATDNNALSKLVREFAAPRYRDGYEKGIHDHDATLLLHDLITLHKDAGVLAFPPASRALAIDFWAGLEPDGVQAWTDRILAGRVIDALSPTGTAVARAQEDLSLAIDGAMKEQGRAFPFESATAASAAAYLVGCVADQSPQFVVSQSASTLQRALEEALRDASGKVFTAALTHLKHNRDAALSLVRQALETLATRPHLTEHTHFVPEAAAMYLHHDKLRLTVRAATLSATVKGLLGQHERILDNTVSLSIDEAMARYNRHINTFIPDYRSYHALRSKVLNETREKMRLEEFKARPLTSFVRNKLINDVYLPVIGDNLAKQMGTVGEGKRSDLMGLLMMISPPGYGKTTLMEYVANRLGLVFMKINGPSLGHHVRSLDPEQAPDATSRQELEKINLALEMGSNVMLYVDDIQHTHPEFLQKFISLCDGTRRIDGVWRGRTKTYDMRGKKFAVVMAGNPYTESGEVFKIPDMLANRADIYNLGDVLGGMEESFLMSYIENSLTSNPVLAPMATRDMSDLYLLMDKALGKEVSTNALKHPYSAAEINEIVAVLKRLGEVRDIVYKVNKQYIASAAQDDRYRVEPPFKLQGSYRNMNKLAEKISPAMNAAEMQQLLSDHYLGESQLLTAGAEENLLKLAELRGNQTPEQQARWTQIKADFMRNKGMGGGEDDIGGRVVAQLSDISESLKARKDELASTKETVEDPAAAAQKLEDQGKWQELLQVINLALGRPVEVSVQAPAAVQPAERPKKAAAEPVVNTPAPAQFSDAALTALADKLSGSNAPLIEAMKKDWEDRSLIGRALVAVMERLATGANNMTSGKDHEIDDVDDGEPRSLPTNKRYQSEFDEILANLRFRQRKQDREG